MQGRIKSTAIIISLLIITLTAGCSVQTSITPATAPIPTTVKATTEPATEEETEEEYTREPVNQTGTTTANTSQFERVYDEYSEYLYSLTPVLIDDYYSALYTAFDEDIEPYSILRDKESQLNLVFNEGLTELVGVKNETDADYSEYDYWEGRLQAVYDNQIDILEDECVTSIGEDRDY